MSNRLWVTLFGTPIIVLMMLVAGTSYLDMQLDKPLKLEDGFVYELKPGATFYGVIADLEQRELIDSSLPAKIASRLTGLGSKIAAGEYEVESAMTLRELITKMERGEVKRYAVTILEGWTYRQVLAALAQAPALEQRFAESAYSRQLLQQSVTLVDKDAWPPEAEFYPDTYLYHRGTTDLEILQWASERLQQVLQEEWEARSEASPATTPREALILASLVEKETGVPAERGTIAGVFSRRLNQKMRLQTDPTIIYGLGESFDGNIRRKHLQDAGNRYNTYRHHGLPPGPIATVARAAIHAALNPEPGTALYFVAKGDGSHYFSDTLEEHQDAVRQYQINQRREDYRSSVKPQSTP